MGRKHTAAATVPNPGSHEAIQQGCKCPRIDNHYGAGIPTDRSGTPLFVMNEHCPLHGRGAGWHWTPAVSGSGGRKGRRGG